MMPRARRVIRTLSCTLLLVSPSRPAERSAASPSTFAAPRVILLYGSPLHSGVVTIEDSADNLQFMLGTQTSVLAPDSALARRRLLHLALFWGPAAPPWTAPVANALSLLPEQASQQAELYLGTRTDPPVLIFGPGGGSTRSSSPRALSSSVLALLKKYGVPTRSP